MGPKGFQSWVTPTFSYSTLQPIWLWLNQGHVLHKPLLHKTQHVNIGGVYRELTNFSSKQWAARCGSMANSVRFQGCIKKKKHFRTKKNTCNRKGTTTEYSY